MAVEPRQREFRSVMDTHINIWPIVIYLVTPGVVLLGGGLFATIGREQGITRIIGTACIALGSVAIFLAILFSLMFLPASYG